MNHARCLSPPSTAKAPLQHRNINYEILSTLWGRINKRKELNRWFELEGFGEQLTKELFVRNEWKTEASDPLSRAIYDKLDSARHLTPSDVRKEQSGFSHFSMSKSLPATGEEEKESRQLTWSFTNDVNEFHAFKCHRNMAVKVVKIKTCWVGGWKGKLHICSGIIILPV